MCHLSDGECHLPMLADVFARWLPVTPMCQDTASVRCVVLYQLGPGPLRSVLFPLPEVPGDSQYHELRIRADEYLSAHGSFALCKGTIARTATHSASIGLEF